jgi:protease-4
MSYLSQVVTYSRDIFNRTVTQLSRPVDPNLPVKPWNQHFKEYLIQFAKNHPYITAELGIFLTSMLIGKISRIMAKQIKQNTILELDLDNLVLTERPVTIGIFDQLNTSAIKKIHYRDIVEALEIAAKDTKVVGLFCRLGNPNVPSEVGLAQYQEIRTAVETFRKANKTTIAFFESLDNHQTSLRYYYLASAFEYIYSPSSSLYFLTGLHADQPFIKETLEKLEMEFEGEQREKYKSFYNFFTEKKLTKEHKEQIESLLTQITEEIVGKIARDRLCALRKRASHEKIDYQGAIDVINHEWFNAAGFSAKQAKDLGVIDEFGYRRDVLRKELPKLCNVEQEQANFLFLTTYLNKKGGNSLQRPKTNLAKELVTYKRQTIAVIYATGNILRGEAPSGYGEDSSKTNIYAENVARALRNAAEDKAVKCIIFRVDSGGGDAIASEIINHEIERIKREKKIKIVVSMGSVAGSGGYWISMSADKIVASETSIVGSIGVVFGKFYTRQFWSNKLGITFDEVSMHKMANIQSSLHKYNDEQKQVINRIIDDVYENFLTSVSANRNKTKEEVREIAQGKIYLGLEAKRLNLVDEIGGFSHAIEVAKELIGVSSDQEIHLIEYPKTVPFLRKYLSTKKPAENSDEQDKQRAISQTMNSSLDLIAAIFGSSPQTLLTRIFTIMFGSSGQSIMKQLSQASNATQTVSAVDNISISLAL